MMQANQTNSIYPYLLAIVPEDPIVSALISIKNSIEKFIEPSLAQLPHITVFPLFYWCDKEEYLLVHHIKNILPDIYSFEVNIKGIKCDRDKKQLYFHTDSNNLFDDCHNQFKNYFTYQTINHQIDLKEVTGRLILANGDLKKDTLMKAWNKVKHLNFEGSFYANKILLLKLDPHGWNVIKHFHLD